MAKVTTEILRKEIHEILKDADLTDMSSKKVRNQIEQKLDCDLLSREKEIDNMVMDFVNSKANSDELDKALQVITNTVQSHKQCELEINKLNDEVVECTNNKIEMRNEMETKFQSLKISSGQIMKEELREHKVRLAKYSNELLQKNKTIEKELRKYEAELKEAKCENEKLKNQITIVTKVQVNERLQLNIIENQNRLLIEQIEILKSEVKSIKDEYVILKSEVKSIKDENVILKSEVKSIKDENVILKSEVKSLNIRISRLEGKDSETDVE